MSDSFVYTPRDQYDTERSDALLASVPGPSTQRSDCRKDCGTLAHSLLETERLLETLSVLMQACAALGIGAVKEELLLALEFVSLDCFSRLRAEIYESWGYYTPLSTSPTLRYSLGRNECLSQNAS